jgi:hypothetical protein
MTTKRARRRWSPTPQQISLAIDCATARMPITRAAELLGVGPRTLWIFVKRLGLPGLFDVWQQQDRPPCVGRAKAPNRRPAGRGVSLNPRLMERPWRARVSLDGRICHLGYFQTKELAHEARDNYIKAHLGERYLKSNARVIAPRDIVMSEDRPA